MAVGQRVGDRGAQRGDRGGIHGAEQRELRAGERGQPADLHAGPVCGENDRVHERNNARATGFLLAITLTPVNFTQDVIAAAPPGARALVELTREGARREWTFGS